MWFKIFLNFFTKRVDNGVHECYIKVVSNNIKIKGEDFMPSDTSGVRTRRSKNSDLHTANRNKKDEFYTQFTDIEKEMKNYKKEFNDKVVFCN